MNVLRGEARLFASTVRSFRQAAKPRASSPRVLQSSQTTNIRFNHRSFSQKTTSNSPQIQSKSPLLRNFFSRRFQSTKPPTPGQAPAQPPTKSLSISERFRKLSREYGWSAVGIYLALSVLDFPFCFLLVRYLGTEYIAHVEERAIEIFWRVVPWPFVSPEDAVTEAAIESEPSDVSPERKDGWGVKKAEKANRGEGASKYNTILMVLQHVDSTLTTQFPGIWTQLALAYAIHKSFIFVRVPATAAITPKVVKVLRGWGWNIGKRKTATATAAAAASTAASK
jgi:hypothetical protein